MPAKTEARSGSKSARPQGARAKATPPPAVLPFSPARFSLARAAAIAALLAAVTVALYSPAGSHPFINYDDPGYVLQNTHLQTGFTWTIFRWALTATEQSNWHPLTWLSHAVDVELFGLNPSGHHWHSVLLHALNVALLFLLLYRVTGAAGRSAVVAGLFALHPLNVESVVWIAERKNVLSTLFFLLTLGAYGWYARKPGIWRYLAVAALFVLALASKPMVITLPFVLLLVDFWPLQRIENWTSPSKVFSVPQQRFGRLVLEKLPLLALSAGSAIVTIWAQTVSIVSEIVLPLSVRLEDALYAYGVYLWKALWPAHLALVYPHPGRTLPWWQPALGALVIAIVSLVAWKRRVKEPYLAVGWLWFLGTAIPIIGIIQVGVQVVADRYAYIPLIGIFVMIAWGAAYFADRMGLTLWPRVVTAVVILAALSFVTWRQIGYWKSNTDIWAHALQVTSGNSIAEHNLADELFQTGHYEEGLVHLRAYGRLEPLDPEAHARLGADLQDRGQFVEAVQEFKLAVRGDDIQTRSGNPGMGSEWRALTFCNLAITYGQLGDEAEARRNIQKALQTDQDALQQMIGQLMQALAAQATAPGYVRLGQILYLIGDEPEARQAFARAQQLGDGPLLPSATQPQQPAQEPTGTVAPPARP